MEGYIELIFELLFDVFVDDGGLADRLISQEDDFEFGPGSARKTGPIAHESNIFK